MLLLFILLGGIFSFLIPLYGSSLRINKAKKLVLILANIAKYRITKTYRARGIINLTGVYYPYNIGGIPCLQILEALLWICLIIYSLIYLFFVISILEKSTIYTKKLATKSNRNMPLEGNIHNLPL